ncbi:hypothetical protein [Streptomyces sp. NPDC002785]|uniref:hypothetical protein n=1 Tax=Streptomyces sp. NPDC002785 TaxID=3154543 RepID=UPI00333486B0
MNRKDGDYRDDWMSAPFNPALGKQAGAAQVIREGGKPKVALPVFSGRDGAPGTDSGSTVLAGAGGGAVAGSARGLPGPRAFVRVTPWQECG